MVRLTLAFTVLVLLHLPALILSSSNPPCVANCITNNSTSSTCNGDETGSALDDCTCKSYESGVDLIKCINNCPAAQANAFASNVPKECRAKLFPNFPGAKAGNAAAGLASSTAAISASGTAAAATATPTTSGSGGEKHVVAGGLAVLGLLAAFAV
jgi:hypothetical protein